MGEQGAGADLLGIEADPAGDWADRSVAKDGLRAELRMGARKLRLVES